MNEINIEAIIKRLKNVAMIVQQLKKGEWIRVHWLDASYAINQPFYLPKVFSTPTITEGRFWYLGIEPETGEPHLILATEWRESGATPQRTDHIPLSCIITIERIGESKESLKKAKSGIKPAHIKVIERIQKVAV
ncbi:MAG: hypothetical protein QXL69_00995 [Candidatus Bathyarchaeia archaeon]|nr:hypothetical protein [Candidatus Bathyarchaeota archaeon]